MMIMILIEAMVMMKRMSLMLMLILKADFYDLMVCFTKCPSSNLRNKIAGARAKVEVSYRFVLTSLVVIVISCIVVHTQCTSLYCDILQHVF